MVEHFPCVRLAVYDRFIILQYDIAKVAALLHRAADLDHMPTMKETKYLLPKPALTVRDIKPPQWVNLVQSSWKEVEHSKPSQAKAHVLGMFDVCLKTEYSCNVLYGTKRCRIL